MSAEFQTVFRRLRSILEPHAGALAVSDDTNSRYCLEGAVGPATLQAWGGKMKSPSVPVAWVQIGKSYVSFHHMAFYGSARWHDSMSKELKARMQGKTCFNFKSVDEALFRELGELSTRGFAGMKKMGFVQ